MVVILVWRSG